MNVGDSAEEFTSINALGREMLLVLSCGLPSNPLNVAFCLPFERRYRVNISVFYTTAASFFQQKMPDRGPPQITDRRVSTVHQGRVGAPNELATLKVHDAIVGFVERSMCGADETTLRLTQGLLWRYFFKQMLAKTAAKNRFFPEKLESSKKRILQLWTHR